MIDLYLNVMIKNDFYYEGPFFFVLDNLTSTEIRLPLGNPQIDYDVIIRVEIIDQLGDFFLEESTIKV